jgi:hypothetical protein
MKVPLPAPHRHVARRSLAHATRRPELQSLRKHVRYTRNIIHFNICIRTPCLVYQSVEIIESYCHEGTLTRTRRHVTRRRLAHATRRPELQSLRKHVRYTRYIIRFNNCIRKLCFVGQSIEIIEGYCHEGSLTRTPATCDETKSSPCYETTRAPIAAQTRSLYALHYTLEQVYRYTLPCLPICWDN